MVLNHEGELLTQVDGNLQPMIAPVAFPREIVIKTNGVFKVGQAKERQLEKGQAITAEGMMYKTNGGVAPVFDHYVAKANRVYVVKEGGAPVLITQNVAFSDGSYLRPDAYYYTTRGNLRRLIDGHALDLQGKMIPSLDTVTFKGGKVTVQKDGAILNITTSLVMNEGTKVLADGTMIAPDGVTAIKLREGQTIALPGAVLRE